MLPPICDALYEWSNGILRVCHKKSDFELVNGKWINHYNGEYSFINHKAELINDHNFDYALDFSEEYAAVVQDGHWGFIAKSGEIVIDCNFQQTYSFQEGYCAAQLDDLWGFINKKGEWIIPPSYEDVQSYKYGLAVAKTNGKQYILDKSGEKVIETPPKYPWVAVKSENIILYGTTSREIGFRYYGLMDIYSNAKLPPEFYVETEYDFDLFYFSDGMLIVTNEDENCGYVNEQLELVYPCLFSNALPFENGEAIATIGDKSCTIDKQGNTKTIEPEVRIYPFDEVLDFEEGLAAARYKNLWGFINIEDDIVIDFDYKERPASLRGKEGLFFSEYYPRFQHGLLPIIKVENDEVKSGFIDNTGQIAIPFKYMFVESFEDVKI